MIQPLCHSYPICWYWHFVAALLYLWRDHWVMDFCCCPWFWWLPLSAWLAPDGARTDPICYLRGTLMVVVEWNHKCFDQLSRWCFGGVEWSVSVLHQSFRESISVEVPLETSIPGKYTFSSFYSRLSPTIGLRVIRRGEAPLHTPQVQECQGCLGI